MTPLGRRGLGRITVTVAAIAVAATMLTGCSVVGDLFPAPPDNTQTAQAGEGSETDVFDLAVGDCMNNTSAETVSTVPVVSCEGEHDYEVYFEIELPGEEFPGEDAVTAAAEQGCAEQFEAFAGIPYDSSSLNFDYLTPTDSSWSDLDDQLVSCLIFDPAGQVEGTLRGVAR